MDSVPPASVTAASPSLISCAAETIACRPEPQRRLSVIAGEVFGTPASIAMTRETYMSRGSVWMTLPKTLCSTASGSMPARAIAALATCVPSAIGG